MHYIQKHILDELRSVDSMRYTQLNTEEIESGHFRYHLGQLVNDGYVEQIERGLYGLTVKGQKLVDKLSEQGVNLTPMPKVITYTLLKDGEKVLLQQKQKQPYMGLFNMIGGKLHEGETAQASAAREVKEKTGKTIDPPRLVGVFEIQINKAQELLTHVVAYVFVADVDTSSFEVDTIKAIKIDSLRDEDALSPDFLPIFERIHNSTQICVEFINVESEK